MKLLLLATSACVSTLLWQGCAFAQPASKEAVASRDVSKSSQSYKLKEITSEFRKDLLKYIQFRRFLYTDPIDCVVKAGDDKCPIPIQLVQVSDANGTYCVGLLPEVVTLRSTASGNPPKRIVWEVIPPSPVVPNAEFFFYDENDHGITWLSNFPVSGQKQLHTGRLGDGSVGSPDRMKWHVRNRHRVKGEGVYVPIVLQRDTLTDKISLCGTPDPRMVND